MGHYAPMVCRSLPMPVALTGSGEQVFQGEPFQLSASFNWHEN
jgi:hypothetical protein